MQARELRQKYLEFFEQKGALRLPSDSLVADDPTLLFTVAGMVPFKAYFEGRATPPRDSLVTAQKCLRTVDIDDIGDTSHCTLFEMMGNFSFGDYFKEEAVTWAWEFLTGVVGLAPENLRVTVFQDDDEAYDLWTKTCGLPADRVTRLGEKTNYWPANAIVEQSQGPCGPCSEIFFDLRPDEPFDTAWDGEGTRWLEIWNLVFTQFTGEGEGEKYRLVPLPKKNIDTGSGLERTAAAINRLSGPFETDVLRPIIASLEALSGISYTATPDALTDIAFRRIADHARAATFLLSDGVTPDRTGRGYVLRRLMRRAIVAGIRRLGFEHETFLDQVIPTVVEVMQDAYPELAERESYLLEQVRQEETLFRRTLQNGLARLEEELAKGTLSGEKAFDLYDTFGLPFEITRELAGERGLVVDETGYREAEETARQRSRAASGLGGTWDTSSEALLSLLKSLPLTRFVGYAQTEAQAKVVGLIVDGTPAESVSEGQNVEILLDNTPFYAEAGGQVGDFGALRGVTGAVRVTDTKKQNGLYFHRATVVQGILSVGDAVVAEVDTERRRDVMRNHTATHLLHRALRDRLGSHVQQRGSLVAPERLRFDFAHGGGLSPADLEAVEAEVNGAILRELPVVTEELPISEAKELGAMMLFGEKYGDVVRVVSVGGEFSREFCGGTHVGNAAQIGPFRLVSEGSAAAGVRRIEAITGRAAEAFDAANNERIKTIAALLGVPAAQTPETIEKLQAEVKSLRQALAQAQRAQTGNQAAALAGEAKSLGGVLVVFAQPTGVDTGDALSALADDILDRVPGGVVVLGAAANGKVIFVAKASRDAVSKGAKAGEIVKAAAQVTGGGGGGRPDFAQAGGKDSSKIGDALTEAEMVLARQLA
ncbi:MAG: alanine--tRNA ligase [Cytophagales bacterium]|nr:alanine--tRNA ligase [Armatimonadota bacterium]